MTNLNFDVDSIIEFPSLNGGKNIELNLEVRRLTFLDKKQKSYVKKIGYNERFKVGNFNLMLKSHIFLEMKVVLPKVYFSCQKMKWQYFMI